MHASRIGATIGLVQEVPLSSHRLLLLGAVRSAGAGQWGLALAVEDALEPDVALRTLMGMFLDEVTYLAELTGRSTAEVFEHLEQVYRVLDSGTAVA